MVFSLARRGVRVADPVRRPRQRRLAGAGGFEIVQRRRDERQLDSGDGLVLAVLPDDRERLAPVALPGEEPVAQFVIDRAPAEALLFQPGGDLALRLRSRQAVDQRRIDRDAFADETDGGFTRSPGGLTTSMIGSSNFRANSKSRSSCAGTAMIAPVP